MSDFQLEIQKEGLPSVWMYGGGRQSVCIAALILQGRLPAPDYAAIADTGREKSSTWKYLRDIVQPKLPFPIHIVKKSEFATVDVWGGKEKDTLLIPAYTNQSGEIGKLETFCSNEWKVRVVDRWLGKRDVSKFIKWIGFSIEEGKRWKPMKKYHADHVRFPLVDDVPLTAAQAVDLIKEMGWPEPISSSCWMCPNMNDRQWKQLTAEEFEQACDFDEWIRLTDPNAYLHKTCQPLRKIKFSDSDTNGGRECESGICFV